MEAEQKQKTTTAEMAVATGHDFMYGKIFSVGEGGCWRVDKYKGYPRVKSGTLGHYLIGVHGWRRNSLD